MKMLLANYCGRIAVVELDIESIKSIHITSICDDQIAYVLDEHGVVHTYDSAKIVGRPRLQGTDSDYLFHEPKCIYNSFQGIDTIADQNRWVLHWETLHSKENSDSEIWGSVLCEK